MKSQMTHGEAEALLPWYANGALEGAERRDVVAHLEHCSICREELAFLGDVRAVLRVSAAAEQPAPVVKNPGFASLPTALQARIAKAPRHGFRKRHWMPALAASFLGAVALGVVLTVTWLDAPRFQTATHGAASSDAAHALVAVRFVPQTALEQLNAMLREHGAVVVRGPDSEDRWLLEIPLKDRTAESLLPVLSESSGVESVVMLDDANHAE